MDEPPLEGPFVPSLGCAGLRQAQTQHRINWAVNFTVQERPKVLFIHLPKLFVPATLV